MVVNFQIRMHKTFTVIGLIADFTVKNRNKTHKVKLLGKFQKALFSYKVSHWLILFKLIKKKIDGRYPLQYYLFYYNSIKYIHHLIDQIILKVSRITYPVMIT